VCHFHTSWGCLQTLFGFISLRSISWPQLHEELFQGPENSEFYCSASQRFLERTSGEACRGALSVGVHCGTESVEMQSVSSSPTPPGPSQRFSGWLLPGVGELTHEMQSSMVPSEWDECAPGCPIPRNFWRREPELSLHREEAGRCISTGKKRRLMSHLC
jgi:hypothetical protein